MHLIEKNDSSEITSHNDNLSFFIQTEPKTQLNSLQNSLVKHEFGKSHNKQHNRQAKKTQVSSNPREHNFYVIKTNESKFFQQGANTPNPSIYNLDLASNVTLNSIKNKSSCSPPNKMKKNYVKIISHTPNCKINAKVTPILDKEIQLLDTVHAKNNHSLIKRKGLDAGIIRNPSNEEIMRLKLENERLKNDQIKQEIVVKYLATEINKIQKKNNLIKYPHNSSSDSQLLKSINKIPNSSIEKKPNSNIKTKYLYNNYQSGINYETEINLQQDYHSNGILFNSAHGHKDKDNLHGYNSRILKTSTPYKHNTPKNQIKKKNIEFNDINNFKKVDSENKLQKEFEYDKANDPFLAENSGKFAEECCDITVDDLKKTGKFGQTNGNNQYSKVAKLRINNNIDKEGYNSNFNITFKDLKIDKEAAFIEALKKKMACIPLVNYKNNFTNDYKVHQKEGMGTLIKNQDGVFPREVFTYSVRKEKKVSPIIKQ